MQQRYYDPGIGRFLSVDPVTANSGTGANFNRYWYANNSPYKFTDLDGRLATCGPSSCVIDCSSLITCGASYAYVGLVYTSRLIANPIDNIQRQESQEPAPEEPKSGDSNPGEGFPDRPLPRQPNGEPAPDPEANGAHTQLGRKEGRNGSYPQARKFYSDGKPVRDIDFTDHGRPDKHSNPHEHPYIDNPTGGTRQRGPERPLPEDSK